MSIDEPATTGAPVRAAIEAILGPGPVAGRMTAHYVEAAES